MSKCDFNKVASKFIEIAHRHGYSPVNLLHIFRTPFYTNTLWRTASRECLSLATSAKSFSFKFTLNCL